MKNKILKALLFLVVNAVGFCTLPLLMELAILLHVFPKPPTDLLYHNLSIALTVVGPLVWIPAALASIGYFFTRGEARLWLLCAPLYIPALYTILVMIYYTFVKS